MLDAILEFILQLVFECVGELAAGLVWTILLPIVWVISSPVVLILAIFSADPYWTSVFELFTTVTTLWSDWGSRLGF
jgi:hypothetical protein